MHTPRNLLSIGFVAAVATACTCPERIGPAWLPGPGQGAYERARDDYLNVRKAGVDPMVWARDLRRIGRTLEEARDGGSPIALHASAHGDVLHALRRPNDAATAYLASVELSEDWVPGWLGLTDVAIETGDFERARGFLGKAESSLAKLARGPAQMNWIQEQIVCGRDGSGESFYDARLTESQRCELLVTQLGESFGWEDALAAPARTEREAIERAKARVLHRFIVLDDLETAADVDDRDRARRLLSALENEVFLFDPDYVAARKHYAFLQMTLARAEFRVGEAVAGGIAFGDAESTLNGLRAGEESRLANDVELLDAYDTLYCDWFHARIDAGIADTDAEESSVTDMLFTRRLEIAGLLQDVYERLRIDQPDLFHYGRLLRDARLGVAQLSRESVDVDARAYQATVAINELRNLAALDTAEHAALRAEADRLDEELDQVKRAVRRARRNS